jgi:hypothetical protein
MTTAMKDLPDVCLEIENSLPLWVGGDLDPEALRAVEEHLAGCTRCADRAMKARGAREILREGLARAAEHGGIGGDPWPRLSARLRAEGLVRTPGESRPRLGAPRRGPTVLRWATAAAVLFAFVFAWGRFPRDAGAPKDPSPVSLEPISASPIASSPIAAKPAGLRHLSPSEHRLRDSAQYFLVPEDAGPVVPFGRLGSPASLERSTTVPPR